MKYNTFWGYVFWCLLLLSTWAELRPVVINFWGLIYNGTIGDFNWFIWGCVHIFFVVLLTLKISLLRWFFPRNAHRPCDLFGTKDICALCAGISTFYAILTLSVIIATGGLKNLEMWRMLQAIVTLLTPFIFIYYLVREEER